MTVDVFQPVEVSVSLVQPIATQFSFNSTGLVSVDTVITTGERARTYDNSDDVSTDFGSTSPEAIFASVYFNQQQQVGANTIRIPNELVILRWDNTDTGGGVPAELSEDAIREAFELTPFLGLGYTNEFDAYSLVGGNTAFLAATTALLDLDIIFEVESPADELFVAGSITNLTYDATQLNQENIFLMGHQQTDEDDPLIERVDGGISSIFSTTTPGTIAASGQSFTGVTANTTSATLTKSTVNTLTVDDKLNMYITSPGTTSFFAYGKIAYADKDFYLDQIYAKIYVKQSLQNGLLPFFRPASVDYNSSGIKQFKGAITNIMTSLFDQGVINQGFLVKAPSFSDFSASDKANRKMTGFQVAAVLTGKTQGISITVSLQTTGPLVDVNFT